jgi:hypothetical protein
MPYPFYELHITKTCFISTQNFQITTGWVRPKAVLSSPEDNKNHFNVCLCWQTENLLAFQYARANKAHVFSSSRVTRLGELSSTWAIAYSGQFLKNYRSSPNFWASFFLSKDYAFFDKKWVGLHFGRLFHKLIRSPCRRAKAILSRRRKGIF